MQLRLHRSLANARRRRTINLPHAMPAAAIDHFGGPEVLSLHVLPVPAIDSAEGLIPLDTAGSRPWDADLPEAGIQTASHGFRWCLVWAGPALWPPWGR